jgi:hypothetical protein
MLALTIGGGDMAGIRIRALASIARRSAATDQSDAKDTESPWSLKLLTLRAGALAGLIVAVGAIVNSAGDLWVKIKDLPVGATEQAEAELFQRHFGKAPVVSQPVSIQRDNVTVDMVIAVYDTGDVLVRYGKQERWLAFKTPQPTALSALPSAFAQTPSEPVTASRRNVDERPSVPNGRLSKEPIHVDVRALQKRRSSAAEAPAQKSFVVAELKPGSKSLTPTSETITRSFAADPGYRFTDAKFEVLSGSKFQVKDVKLSDDQRTATVTFMLTSGPIYDQYRSWLQGTLRANQEPIR